MLDDNQPGGRYLIWSNEHQAWWRAGGTGYTKHLREAGRYTQADALETCVEAMAGAREALNEVPVRCRYARAARRIPRAASRLYRGVDVKRG